MRATNIPGWLLTAPTNAEVAAQHVTCTASHAVSVSEVLLLHTMVVEPIMCALPDALATMLQEADEAALSHLLESFVQYLQAENPLQAANDAKGLIAELLTDVRNKFAKE